MATKLNVDLEALSVQELTKLIDEAQTKLADKREGAKAALLEEMASKAAELGMSLEALVGKSPGPQSKMRKVRADSGKPVPARFRGPDDSTWSGRGRMPKWLSEAIERGKKKEDFAV
ncbi:hypothetical protein EAH89_15545 [Roseomonas nepalensis]|uniref:DNA-binding protein H-NS-like C-terminal domain-containing protein n=1 Tax=Muricoccus nepalensis TaxID=1854500 RepID=A0A502FVX5_9PROT|nr:H-NS histone family protein [Roseomonas nepalensis]TPG53624.1 hypothetical protein EAH89_15545 [Roseomonas nepalensis]